MQQASEAAKLGDQRALHKVIRLLAPKQTRVKLQLRNSSGYLMSDDEEALHIRQHMESLYVDKGAENLEDMYCSSLPFSEYDLYKSLGDLPARKASPPGFSESAFVKHASSIIAPILYGRLKINWENSQAVIPSKWRLSWLCWIPKPYKNHAHMSGWRGISLQSVIGKSVLRCVERAARAKCDHILRQDPQFAYTKSRGTGDAIARALVHQAAAIKSARSTNRTIHDQKAGEEKSLLGGGLQVCLDINQAFDKVPRKALMEHAASLEVGDADLSLLNNWHINTEYVSATSGEDVVITANSGVRQGCVAAPSLWNMYIHGFLQRLAVVFSSSWVRDHITVYADDFHIFFVFLSEEEFQKVLVDLRRFLDELLAFGLDLNMDKTVVLLNMKGGRAPKWRKKVLRKEGDVTRLKTKTRCSCATESASSSSSGQGT